MVRGSLADALKMIPSARPTNPFLRSRAGLRPKGSSSTTSEAVPLYHRRPTLTLTFGFAIRFFTYSQRMPCSATIQKVDPSSPLPTGVNRASPVRLPVVSSKAKALGGDTESQEQTVRGVEHVLLQQALHATPSSHDLKYPSRPRAIPRPTQRLL